MSERLCELRVADVLAAVPTKPGQESGLVVLAETSLPNRKLSIYIGQPEARAVQAARRGDVPSRPSTWDLFLATLTALDAVLSHAVIDKVEESRHFFAKLHLACRGSEITVDCRPSDAIALLVRRPGAALYATEDVLSAAGRYGEDIPRLS